MYPRSAADKLGKIPQENGGYKSVVLKKHSSGGPCPNTAGTFRRKLRKKSGKTPETLSERFLEFPSRVRLGSPKPYNSRHLRLPEHFQNLLPLTTAGDTSFFRSGSGEGLSELVMGSVWGGNTLFEICPLRSPTSFAICLCFLHPHLRWAKSPIANRYASHSALPCGTTVKQMNANRAIRIAAQRTQRL